MYLMQIFLLFLLVSQGVFGCKRVPSRKRVDGVTHRHGVLQGLVHLKHDLRLPRYSQKDMAGTKLGSKPRPLPSLCDKHTLDGTVVSMSANRGLGGILLSLTGFRDKTTRKTKIHQVTIENCRIEPPMIVAMKGDTLKVTNNTRHTFMPTLGKAPLYKSLGYQKTIEFKLPETGVLPLTCGLRSPCGRSDIVVLHHGLATKSRPDGSFRLGKVPRREKLVVHAWHPLFKESKKSFVLDAKGRRALRIEMKPRKH